MVMRGGMAGMAHTSRAVPAPGGHIDIRASPALLYHAIIWIDSLKTNAQVWYRKNFVKSKRKINLFLLGEVALILVVSAMTYLPYASQGTYYRDDWYFMVDRSQGGPAVFPAMFSIDRPARAPVYEFYYQLFGLQPLPYQLTTFAWRLLSGLAALWLFRLLWPRQRLATWLGALLFTIYPGYQWWVAIEFIPHVVSVFLQTVSIAMTLQAIHSTRIATRIAWLAGSVLTGWAYLALVDYAIGMEVFRLLCVFVVVTQKTDGLSFLKKSMRALRAWAISAVIPIGYLIWRLIFFQNLRGATDLGLQLSIFPVQPLRAGIDWLVHFIHSALNVAVLAWGVPFYQKLFSLLNLHVREVVVWLGLTTAAVGCVILAVYLIEKSRKSNEGPQAAPEVAQKPWQAEAVWIGSIGVAFGALPVIVANRYIVFDAYSHYALPASLAGVILLIGLVHYLSSRPVRLAVICALVGIAITSQYAVSIQALSEEKTIADFWWQVTWRAPGGIRPGATLLAYYPGVPYGEDMDTVAGPANILYASGIPKDIPVQYTFSALAMTSYMPHDVLAGGPKKVAVFRSHEVIVDYANILVMSQPTDSACVHVFDGRWPRYSDNESERILLVGQVSKIQNVLTNNEPIQPPTFLFGQEPAHGWCYYYEKAELAFQQGDWQGVAAIELQTDQLNLKAADAVEWMPFIQAYAMLGDTQKLKQVVGRIDASRSLMAQACNTLKTMQQQGAATINQQVLAVFCN